MSLLNNSASISSYSYSVGPGISRNDASNVATLSIEVTGATITFTKSNSPNYIKPGNATTITYSVTNLNPEAISSITIEDPIFTTLGVTITQTAGGTITNDILTITIPGTGELATGATAQATVTLLITDAAHPDSTVYDTTANGSFVLETTPETTITKTSKGHLEVNAAIITMSKTVFPNISTITAGNLLTFTIVFTNTGNVDATIPIGHFTDTWPIGSMTNVVCTNTKFSIGVNSITNAEDLIIPADTTKTLIYTGIAISI